VSIWSNNLGLAERSQRLFRADPRTVFTPNVPPSDDVFTQREKENLQKNVREAFLTPGLHLLLYGPTGVGKTSLITHVCQEMGIRYVRVDCSQSDHLPTLIQWALANVEPNRTSGGSVESGGEASATGHVVGGKLSIKSTIGYAPRDRNLGDELIEVFRKRRYRLLFFDNFEDLAGTDTADESKETLLRLMKYLSDQSGPVVETPKIGIAGTGSAARDLLAMSGAAARRTRELHVPTMSVQELEAILQKGEKKLRMAFDDASVAAVVRPSMGLPYYTHLLALLATQAALNRTSFFARRKTVMVEARDVADAQLAAMNQRMLQLEGWFDRACGTEAGGFKPRREALFALAELEEESSSTGGGRRSETLRGIRESILARYPQVADRLDAGALKTALNDLERARVVARQTFEGRADSYALADPLIAGYIRIRMAREIASVRTVTFQNAVASLNEQGLRHAAATVSAGLLTADEHEQRFVLSYAIASEHYYSAEANRRDIEAAVRSACPIPADAWSFEIGSHGDGFD